MGSLNTRHLIHSGGDYYLCPLSKTQVNSQQLQQYLLPVKAASVELEDVNYDYANGKTALIAQGYEQIHTCQFQQDGNEITWQERHLVVYSIVYAKAQQQAFYSRIEKTRAQLDLLNQTRRGKKPFPDLESFTKVAQSIVSKHRVASLFQLSCDVL